MKLKGKYIDISRAISFIQQKWVLFGIVILVASVWRLTNLSLVEFKGDESLNLFLASRPLFGHPLPPASLASSVGILNFPLLNYFLFPITLFSTYPPFVSGVIALLNVLALGGYFLILTKYFNRLTAFMTTMLLAVAPWAIIYSRKIWAQDFLIPLVVALLFCFFKIYAEQKQKYWLGFGMVSLFLVQIHQTAGILPFLLFFLLLRKARPHLIFLSLGILLGLIPTLPYMIFEVANKCPDCTTLSLLHGKLQNYHPDIFLRIFQITTTGDFHTLLGNTDYAVFVNLFPRVAQLAKVTYLMYVLLPISMVFFLIKSRQYRSFVVITLFILSIFFFIKIQPEMHYVIILLPFLFLFIGTFIATLSFQKNALWQSIGILLFVTFIIIFSSFDYSFFHLLSQKKGFGGDYGSTYTAAYNSAKKALQQFKNNPSYNEMLLAYYVPKGSIMGDTPVGGILYPLSEERNKLPLLQKQISDPRAFNQLVAYYTYPQTETHQNLFYLQKQAVSSAEYQTIYQLALSDYLQAHLRQYYTDSRLWIEFPEHWHVLHEDHMLSLSDEIVSFTLSPQKVSDTENYLSWNSSPMTWNGQRIIEYDCYDNDIWCGSIIPDLHIGQDIYKVVMTKEDTKADQQLIANEKKVLDSVFDAVILY